MDISPVVYFFFRKKRQLENIPPMMQNALLYHTLRAEYQAGHVWGPALCREPSLPSSADFGWIESNSERVVSYYI